MSDVGSDLPPDDESAPPRKGDRMAWYIVGALVVLWIGYLAFFGPRDRGGPLGPPVLDDPLLGQADFSWTLEDLDGQTVELARYRGRAIFLNIWATWCGPCLMEMPSIEKLASNPKLRDVAFLAISNEDAATLRQFLDGKSTSLTILRAPDMPPGVFLTPGIPATFLIAPDGRIAAAHVGSAQWDDPAVVQRLADLASSAPAAPSPVEEATSSRERERKGSDLPPARVALKP